MTGSNENVLVRDIITSVKAANKAKTSGYDSVATVLRIEGGTAWVHFDGGVNETPAKLTINAKVGDQVQVRVANGTAFLVGNATAPPTDDQRAIEANDNAEKAGILAQQAIDDAVAANQSAMLAQNSAEAAQASADEAATAASNADKHAADALESANTAYEEAKNAITSANQAKNSAQDALGSAQRALTSAERATESAVDANVAANSALDQLSTVEDVVDVLNWIAHHGVYSITSDTAVQSGKKYYRLTASIAKTVSSQDIKSYYVLDTETGVYSASTDTEVAASKVYDLCENDLPLYYEKTEDPTGSDLYVLTEYSSIPAKVVSHETIEEDPSILSSLYEYDGASIYTLTKDETVVASKTYYSIDVIFYTLSDFYYTVVGEQVASPIDSELSTYYELILNEAVSNYIHTHLALTNDGLWVLNGNTSSYKVRIDNDSVDIINDRGSTVASYGETTYVGNKAIQHIEITPYQLSILFGASASVFNVTQQTTETEEKTIVYTQSVHYSRTNDYTIPVSIPYNDIVRTFTVDLYLELVLKDEVLSESIEFEVGAYKSTSALKLAKYKDYLLTYNGGGLLIIKNRYYDQADYPMTLSYSARAKTYKSTGASLTYGNRLSAGENQDPNGAALGNLSGCFGIDNRATNACSFAFGGNVTAGEDYAFAEGRYSKANGKYSHAEGISSLASAYASHAEGDSAHAAGNMSHAQNDHTIARGESQTAIGRFNSEDQNNKYAFIVGNGSRTWDPDTGAAIDTRSNAHTLDWEGNAEYAGKVTAGADPTDDNDLVPKKYMEDRLPAASSTTPLMDGEADPGSETAFARGDHVHPSDSSKLDTAGGTMTGDLEMAEGKKIDGVDVSEVPKTYVKKAGDTMTGQLTIDSYNMVVKTNVINKDTPPSSGWAWGHQVQLADKNANRVAYMELGHSADNRLGFEIGAVRNINGSNVYNYIEMFINGSGAQTVDINAPAAWRDAIFPSGSLHQKTAANAATLGNLYNCSGTKHDNFYFQHLFGRFFVLTGRFYITDFSRTGSNPGVYFTLPSGMPTPTVSYAESYGFRGENANERIQFVFTANSRSVRASTTETFTNASGTRLTFMTVGAVHYLR